MLNFDACHHRLTNGMTGREALASGAVTLGATSMMFADIRVTPMGDMRDVTADHRRVPSARAAVT
jgi:hypothetical protein